MTREHQFLYSGEAGQYLTTIQSLMEKSHRIHIAVAFWGKDSIEKLTLHDKDIKKDVRIVCSLKNGISNPDVVKKLRDIYGENVRQYPNLHAKVFLFDKEAVVGSANVSTFGLPSTEAEEASGWMEAGVRLGDARIVGEIEKWYDMIWKDSQPITDDDIRGARKFRQLYRQITLFETLEKLPDFFDADNDADKWMMAISSEIMSDERKKKAEEACETQLGVTMDYDRFDFYDEWDGLKEGMKIMDFSVKRKPEGPYKVTYEGIWHIMKKLDKDLHLAHSCPEFPKKMEPKDKDEWKKFINFIIDRKCDDMKNPAVLLRAGEVIELLKQYKER